MMTQGYEPHGDGEGREELLIRACGISYGYHRTDSVLSPRLRLSRHPAAVTPSGTAKHKPASLLPSENREKAGMRVRPWSNLLQEGVKKFFDQCRPLQLGTEGHHGGQTAIFFKRLLNNLTNQHTSFPHVSLLT